MKTRQTNDSQASISKANVETEPDQNNTDLLQVSVEDVDKKNINVNDQASHQEQVLDSDSLSQDSLTDEFNHMFPTTPKEISAFHVQAQTHYREIVMKNRD